MANNFASGTLSKAICDRCGLRFKYTELKMDGNIPGLYVCNTGCCDPIDPYKLPPRLPDNYVLHHPRPDVSVAEVSPTLPPLFPDGGA